MQYQCIRSLSKDLQIGKISCTEVVQNYLQKIKNASTLNAFISYDEEKALATAAINDKKEKKDLPLFGIPVAHKDNFCTLNLPTTCASKMLADFISPYPATIVERLENSGTILIGKTNMDEFAMGSSNETSYFGPVKNPWNLDYVPGGSSGGSAAAVAADLVPFATGTDTGGSIRQPSAFCGLSGIKPTYGLVSRFGMVAYASSLDQAGALAHSADDLAFILSAMAGFDEKDSTSVNKKLPNYSQIIDEPIKKIKIGLPKCFFNPAVDPAIQKAIEEAVRLFSLEGFEIIDIDLKLHDLWIACYYVIACAEASSNLSRFDGIRYGHRSSQADTVKELIENSRSEGFGQEVKRRILTGTHLLSAGYFDAYYVQAQKIRRMIQEEFLNTFKNIDIILGPTTPVTAFKLGENISNPQQKYLSDIFNVPVNLSGLPAMSIPVGFSSQLPIGMQLIANHFEESLLLQVAHRFQKITDWHLKRPNAVWEQS